MMWEEQEEQAAQSRHNDEMLMGLVCFAGNFWLKVFKILLGLWFLVNFWPLIVIGIGLMLAWKNIKQWLSQKMSE